MIYERESLEYDQDKLIVDVVLSDTHNFTYKLNTRAYVRLKYIAPSYDSNIHIEQNANLNIIFFKRMLSTARTIRAYAKICFNYF